MDIKITAIINGPPQPSDSSIWYNAESDESYIWLNNQWVLASFVEYVGTLGEDICDHYWKCSCGFEEIREHHQFCAGCGSKVIIRERPK